MSELIALSKTANKALERASSETVCKARVCAPTRTSEANSKSLFSYVSKPDVSKDISSFAAETALSVFTPSKSESGDFVLEPAALGFKTERGIACPVKNSLYT